VAEAATVWAASRAALAILTVGLLLLLRGDAGGEMFRPTTILTWERWDTRWYLAIAQHGYFSRDSANFFPLYPLLTAVFSQALAAFTGLGLSPELRLAAALAVSNLGALVGFVAIALLADDEREGRHALTALVAYPLAFFMAAAYTEGPFLALAGLTLLFARRGRWGWAWLTSFLAGLTRSTAIVLILPLLWEFWRQRDLPELARERGWRQLPFLPGILSRDLLGAAAAASGVPVGMGLYMAFLGFRFGDPLLFVHTQQSTWHHVLSPPWSTLQQAAAQAPLPISGLEPLDLALVLLFGLLTMAGARRLPFAYTLYTIGLLALILVSPVATEHDTVASSGRYLLAAIPCFLLLGRLLTQRPALQLLVLGSGFMLQALLAAVFLSGGPVL
jgi:hypothetical protein